MSNESLNARNIKALHENNKLLNAKFQKVHDELDAAKQQIAQLRQDVIGLRTQVLLSATSVGRGPTHGNNN